MTGEMNINDIFFGVKTTVPDFETRPCQTNMGLHDVILCYTEKNNAGNTGNELP